MDDKVNAEKSTLLSEKGDNSKFDLRSSIVSRTQQQQPTSHNEKDFVQLQYHLLWLMRTEKRMHDTKESNYQFWSLVTTQYLTICSNLVKVVNADSVYLLSLPVADDDDKNVEKLKTRCRMIDSYELMIVISQSLQRINFTFTKFRREQTKCYWSFRLIMSYIQDLEEKLKSIDQQIKSVENTIKIIADRYNYSK